jgi:NAD(P)-dependent dehydrogenase (short-subunit alcohol dehydrogenase family)
MAQRSALLAGIGRLGVPVAENLVSKGWRIAVSYREGHGSEKTVKGLAEKLGRDFVRGINASIEEKQGADHFISASLEGLGKADALICFASGYPGEKQDWQRWERGLAVRDDDWDFYLSNFFSARNPALSLLRAKNNPARDLSIIFFSDARSLLYMDPCCLDPYEKFGGVAEVSLNEVKEAGLRQLEKSAPAREINPYTLAKRDLGHLTMALALDHRGGNIRVNTIAPGPILPPPDKSEEEARSVVEQTLLKRWGGEAPIVQAVDFFLENSFVSGEILRVDGGFNLYNRFRNESKTE